MAATPPSAPPPAATPSAAAHVATAAVATPLAATRPASRRRAWRWLGGSVAAVVVLVAISIGLLTAALHSSSGSAWLVTLLPQLKVVGPQGSLLGDFAAERIEISLPGSSGVLRVDAPRWHALGAGPGDHGRWLHLRIDSLHADRVTLLRSETPTPPDSKPPAPPATLRLPIELEIRTASVDELRLGAGEEATRLLALRGGVHLGDAGGGLHRFDALEARYQQARASGRASIAADAPFQVDAQLALLYEDATPAWQANAAAVGPLEALHVTATARRAVAAARADSTVRPNAGSASAAAASASASASPASVPAPASAPVVDTPSLTADATIKPFAAWPLGQLRATTQGLDLAAFSGSAPTTALSGEATVTTTGMDRPASVLIELRNGRAGRWNEGLLPVQRLHADLRARPDAPSALDIQTLVAELGSAQSAAGRVDARGHWSPESWRLEAKLDKVRANGLDARAPDTALDGTLSASSRAPSTATAPARTASLPAAAAERAIAIAGDLAGTLVHRRLPRSAPRLARLRFDARAGDRDIELHSAEASLGSAKASLAGRISRPAADAPWHAAGRVALSDFDPAPWWPGPPDSLLSRGPNRLNAKADFDVVLARNFAGSAYDILAATRGKATLSMADSVLAGVPLEADASFVNSDGTARPSLDLLLAGNRLKARGRVAASATADAWTLDVDAPQLVRLAPLARRPGTAASGPAASGTLTAKASIDGRWPNLTSEGELHAAALRFDTVAVRQAEAHWRLGSAADAAVEATLTLDGASVSGRVVERVRAQASGTARAHRLLLDIASDALPPQWLDAVAAPTASTVDGVTVKPMAGAGASPVGAQGGAADIGRSALTLRAEGGLVDVGSDRSGGWSGTVQELIAQSTAPPRRTWLHARGVRGSVLWAGGPMRASVEPGMAEALGATVRWSRIAWQAGDARTAARLDAQAVVEPVLIAPLLRTLQPDFGWAGDLRVGAHVNVRSAPSVLVDVVVERASGDLSVTDEFGTQALGFSDLRFGIAAKDGVWNFTGALAGSTLGVASAALTARTSSAATWPSADTPIQGVAELRVANLGTWGPWVPAGWRLVGALHANASIAGRFGRPEYVGHVEGTNLGVRNFLQGVNITEGDVAIALQGSTARIERFTAKGGSGSLKLDGSASFDAAPAAQLRLSADRFELLGRRDRRIVASGAASMHLDAQSLGLDGAFKVDEGLIDFTRSDAPSLGDDVEVVRRPTPAASSPAGSSGRTTVAAVPSAAASAPVPALAAAPTSRKVALDLRVDLGEKLRIRGRGLDAGLRGELRLTSPGGRLAANGTVRAVDGTYQAYGQKLGIDRGVISFVGPIENPRLDIEATRPNLDVRVGVVVVGSALDPRVRLFSEPDMSDIDKLSWLVLGRASEGVGSNDIALLQSAALALLSGEGPGVTDRLLQSIGLDSFGVRQQSVGDVKETIVTLGKQISKRWYVGYERGLNATTGSWQLIYRLAQRVTIRAQAGGDNSVDLIWTLRWK